jgi:hypothetical protein
VGDNHHFRKGKVKMRQHVTVVAAMRIGFGALGLFLALVCFVAITGGGLISGDEEAITITSIVGTVVGGFLALLSLPGIIGGIGLLQGKPWARILVLILAVFDLFNIPIGTAIGVYTIWVLMQEETEDLFAQGAGVLATA